MTCIICSKSVLVPNTKWQQWRHTPNLGARKTHHVCCESNHACEIKSSYNPSRAMQACASAWQHVLLLWNGRNCWEKRQAVFYISLQKRLPVLSWHPVELSSSSLIWTRINHLSMFRRFIKKLFNNIRYPAYNWLVQDCGFNIGSPTLVPGTRFINGWLTAINLSPLPKNHIQNWNTFERIQEEIGNMHIIDEDKFHKQSVFI